jgi:ABC-type polysaccharide/polyol phosphate export permease
METSGEVRWIMLMMTYGKAKRDRQAGIIKRGLYPKRYFPRFVIVALRKMKRLCMYMIWVISCIHARVSIMIHKEVQCCRLFVYLILMYMDK